MNEENDPYIFSLLPRILVSKCKVMTVTMCQHNLPFTSLNLDTIKTKKLEL